MKKLGIPGSDGKNHVIDPSTGQIAVIGFQYVDNSRQFLPDKIHRKVRLVELFYDSADSDFWYFGEDGALLFNCISEKRSGFVLKIYREVTKSPGIDINTFLNITTSCWSGYILGDISEDTFED